MKTLEGLLTSENAQVLSPRNSITEYLCVFIAAHGPVLTRTGAWFHALLVLP